MDVDSRQPPWATELLARNRKVARNIWSTSLDSDNGSSDCVGGGDVFILSNGSRGGEEQEEGRRTMVKRGMTTNMKMAREQGKVVDPTPSSSAYIRTEKSAPIRDEVTEDEDEMKEKNAEESILEYGPGIVRKLRSRYQSLALRQSVGRPTLRRSTSLENCLDSVSSEQLSSDSPSPVPYHYEDEMDSGRRGGVSGGESENNNNMIIHSNNNNGGLHHHHPGMNRGRAAYSEYNTRKDRMKRARSVDALHRPLHRRQEEDEKKEILEKFRTVVSPKEDVVIIEVSKPRANISSFNGGSSSENNYYIDDKYNSQQQHLYLNNNHGYSGNSSESNRVRSVTSPEHELPPPNIVCETARIFEKNHDNNNQGSPNNLLISGIKKVGHALRLSKSSSVSPSSSPLPSPTTTTSYTTMMNGQIDGNGSYQNKNHLMAQGSNNLTAHQKFTSTNKQQQESFQRDKNFIVNGSTSSSSSNFSPNKSPNNNFVANHNSISPNKQIQIGVIRPTVTTTSTPTPGPVITPNGVISSTSSKVNTENLGPKKISSIDVSPIQSSNNNNHNSSSHNSASTPLNKFLHQHSNKPPLSPKPLFTSSPKNFFLVNNNSKTGGGGGKMTESCTNNSIDNAKSPQEEPYDGNLIYGKSSSYSTTTPSIVQTHGLIPNGNSNSKNIPMSIEKSSPTPPSDKENKEQKEIMEFQKISLKPVAKQSEHSEIILSNGTTTTSNNNNSNSNHKMNISNHHNKTNNESKTEKKDQKSNAKQQQTVPKPAPSTVPIVTSSVEPSSKGTKEQAQQQQSQLRAHQKQKLAQQTNNGNGSQMVFNFTNRQKVPDYIEDDGLHCRITLGGTVTDESQDDDGEGPGWSEDDHVDARFIQFEGANVIINGRSSIQKKPKSQKLNISFNEDATTTFEYPSEASILGSGDDDTNDSTKDTLLGHKSPNILNSSGGGLGSYTPSKTGKTYQLGNFNNRNKSPESNTKKEDNSNELIEDYLKPDEGSTTWSNEMGADILF